MPRKPGKRYKCYQCDRMHTSDQYICDDCVANQRYATDDLRELNVRLPVRERTDCDCGICPICKPGLDLVHAEPAFQRVAQELRKKFAVEIRYNCDLEAFVKNLEKGRL